MNRANGAPNSCSARWRFGGRRTPCRTGVRRSGSWTASTTSMPHIDAMNPPLTPPSRGTGRTRTNACSPSGRGPGVDRFMESLHDSRIAHRDHELPGGCSAGVLAGVLARRPRGVLACECTGRPARCSCWRRDAAATRGRDGCATRFMESPLSFFRMHWDHEPWRARSAFEPAGSGEFPVARSGSTGLESPVNPQAGKPALQAGSWKGQLHGSALHARIVWLRLRSAGCISRFCPHGCFQLETD